MTHDRAASPWILPTIMFGPFVSMLDSGIVNVGLPSMAVEFRTSPDVIQWVASAYLLTVSALLPFLGSVADQIGRKRIFSAGFLVLAVFSLLSTWAPSLPVLIATRLLQGVGGAMIIANGMALATEHHPASQRGRNLGLLTTVGALGSILGPSLGGLLIGAAGWRSVFYLSAAVGAVGWVASLVTIPHDAKQAQVKFQPDFVGAMLLAAAIVAFSVGLSLGWFVELAAAGLLAAFLLWERRAKHPILRLELFANRTFFSSWFLALGAFVAFYAPTVLIPYYFQAVRGWSPETTGLAMMAFPLAMAVVSPLSGRLSDRLGPVKLGSLGLALGMAGLLGLAFVVPEWSPFVVVGGLAVLGLSMGLFLPPNNSSLMGAAPKHLLGSATGFTQLARNLGTAAGISLAGTAFGLLQGPGHELDASKYYGSASLIYFVAAGLLALAAVYSLRRLRE